MSQHRSGAVFSLFVEQLWCLLSSNSHVPEKLLDVLIAVLLIFRKMSN